MHTEVLTPEQRLAILIGEIYVTNAKLGYERDALKQALSAALTRADAAEQRLREIETRPE